MGKIKNRKCGNGRTDPIGLSASENNEEQILEDPSSHSGYVQNIYDQLKSHVVEERDSGLNSLSVACQNKSLVDEILANDIVKTAGPLLVDPSAIVRHSAAGALRNMSSISPAVCDLMVTQDIMTPLVTLLKQKYQADWTVQHPKPAGIKIDTVTETFSEAVSLLWNLCESNETALKIFNREGLAGILSKCLNVESYGIRVGIVVAQCLNTVTEDNPEAIPDSTEFELGLRKILTNEGEDLKDWHYLQTLVIGILLNLQNGQVSKLSPETTTLVINILCSVLNVDHIVEINKFSSDVPIRTLNGMEQINKVPDEDSHPKDEIDVKKLIALDLCLDKVHNVISAQVLALEILSNIMFQDDEEEESSDNESEESLKDFHEDIDDCAVDSEMEDVGHGLPSEIYDVIISQKIVDKVISKLKMPPANVIEILTESKEYSGKILEKVTQLTCTSLLCFQNLIAALDFSDIGFDPMKTVWISLGSLLVQSDSSNVDFVEANTSAMRALMQKWVDTKCFQIVESISAADLNVFYEIYQRVPVAKVHINLIKIIGGMGFLLANKGGASTVNPEVEPLLGQVGSFLMTCISTPSEKGKLWIVAEALDTLFDVFSEDNYNHVMQKLGIIDKLKVFLPLFRKQIQNQRRELGENKAVIQTAKTNLSRFIDYKVKHGAV